MTTDEFERIVVAFRHMQALQIMATRWLPLEAVIRVIHSQLHADDRQVYSFDFEKNLIIRRGRGETISSGPDISLGDMEPGGGDEKSET